MMRLALVLLLILLAGCQTTAPSAYTAEEEISVVAAATEHLVASGYMTAEQAVSPTAQVSGDVWNVTFRLYDAFERLEAVIGAEVTALAVGYAVEVIAVERADDGVVDDDRIDGGG